MPELLRRPAAACALSTPGAPGTLADWARGLEPGRGTRELPIRVVVGPEGGLTRSEQSALEDAGAQPVALGPFVLRVETAAEAAVAALVQARLGRAAGSRPRGS